MPNDPGASSVETALLGSTIAGRYQLVRPLGDGGMGAVYKAADVVLRRFVAIKLLHHQTTRNSRAAVDRFQREARAAAAIGHPNIIDILDFGVEGERPYMVMEYLRGRSLSQLLSAEGPLAIARACSIAAHTLAGLAAAHERGILHRDLKPANLMLVSRFGDKSFVKVCDFGFAALMGPSSVEDGKTLTPARTLVGTPAYAAPERLRGDERRDPRIDLYSVGVVLYEMLAGRRPFEAPSFRELAKKVWQDPPAPLERHRPEIPRRLAEVVRRALEKDPARRFSSAGELAAALVPFGGRSVTLEDDDPSDSFAFEVAELKARDQRKRGTQPSIERPPSERPGGAGPAPPEPRTSRDVRMPERARLEPGAARLADLGDEAERLRRGAGAARAADPSGDPSGDVERFRRGADAAPAPVGPPRLAAGAARSAPLADTLTSLAEVRGKLAVAVLRFVERRFGARALRELLGAMPAGERAPFEAGVVEEAWLDAAALRALVEAIDRRLGADDLHMVVECGRAAAEACFEDMRALRLPSPPPELLAAELPAILGGLVRGTEVAVRRVGRGYARYEIFEVGAPSLTTSVLLLGFVERSLGRFGGGEVEVNLASARALDDAQTILDASWLG